MFIFTHSTKLNALIHLIKIYNGISIDQPQVALLVVKKRIQPTVFDAKTFSSQRITNQPQSFVNRKHVTSTQNPAEANLVSPVILRERITDFKPKTKPVKLPVNIVYRCCPAKSALDDRFNDYHSLSTSSATSLTFELDRHRHGIIGLTSKRPLVLILAWMLAKETHIDKYREFWFKRGCDVLSVRTSPLALLLPNIGGRQNAVHVYDFIANFRPSYEKIIVHAFSVGGYQLSEILHMLDHNVLNGDKLARKIYDSLKAIIIDSCVYPEEAPSGLSRAITKNPIVQPLIEKSIYNFLTLTKSFTRDRYIEVEKHLFANRNKIPGLVLYSEDDLVSSVKLNEKLYQSWNSKGVVVDFQCWQNSIHVLHYREHKNEYEQKVDQFLSKINISK